jgi:hypothetical protein
MPPQVRPVTIKHEIEQALNRLGLEYEIDIYKSLLGHEGKGVEPLVQSAEEIYQHLFGKTIQPEAPDRASIWTDTNVYNELGDSRDQNRSARPAHRPAKRRNRDRCNGQSGADLCIDGLGHLQPRTLDRSGYDYGLTIKDGSASRSVFC